MRANVSRAVANKVPTISLVAEAVPYGLLMSYGPDFPEFFRRRRLCRPDPERRCRLAGRAADSVSTGRQSESGEGAGAGHPAIAIGEHGRNDRVRWPGPGPTAGGIDRGLVAGSCSGAPPRRAKHNHGSASHLSHSAAGRRPTGSGAKRLFVRKQHPVNDKE
jgi:hypothetical protein